MATERMLPVGMRQMGLVGVEMIDLVILNRHCNY